jgi:peptide/nickel transport system permease protein
MRTIARRLAFYAATAIVAISVDFFIPRIIPGNPVNAILAKMQGATLTKATIAALDEQYGVNTKASVWTQYAHFWGNVVHGNLGTSTSNGFVAVSTVIREALPWTLGLVGVATVISFVLGTLIGVLVAGEAGSTTSCPPQRSSRQRPTSSSRSSRSTCSPPSLAGSPPARVTRTSTSRQ